MILGRLGRERGERERDSQRQRNPTAKYTCGVGDILLIKKKLLREASFFYIIEMYRSVIEAAVKM